MKFNMFDAVGKLPDSELLAQLKRLAVLERCATAQLVAHLAEMDARRLYLGERCSSLFAYCTQVLHLSEHAAYLRIEAARAARRHPAILDMLASGALHLTAVGQIAAHLTPDNVDHVLAAAVHKTKREVEELVASLAPVVRPAPPAETRPSAVGQYFVKCTISRETFEKLTEAQALLRHQIPSGDVAQIVDRALTLLVTQLRKSRHAAADRPRRPGVCVSRRTRHIPAAVKRAVWARDGGQCAFVGTAGRCASRAFLEYHHVVPFADGGESTVANIQLRCRAHNAFEAERWVGGGDGWVREDGVVYGRGVSTRSGPS